MPLSNAEKQKAWRERQKRKRQLNEYEISKAKEALEKLAKEHPEFGGTVRYVVRCIENIRW